MNSSTVDLISVARTEGSAILRHLEGCRPYRSDQGKSDRQLQMERLANYLMYTIGGLFVALLLMLLWKKSGWPVDDRFMSAALWISASSEILAIPWFCFHCAAALIERRDKRRNPGRVPARDRCLLEAEHDEHHAHGLMGYSYAALVRVQHGLRREISDLAWLKLLPVPISCAGQYAMRHQFDMKGVELYFRTRAFISVPRIEWMAALAVCLAVVICVIWVLFQRRRRSAYRLVIVDLALSLKHDDENAWSKCYAPRSVSSRRTSLASRHRQFTRQRTRR